jgi:hypothetical protein
MGEYNPSLNLGWWNGVSGIYKPYSLFPYLLVFSILCHKRKKRKYVIPLSPDAAGVMFPNPFILVERLF